MNSAQKINLLFDMETGDPDDVMTLCFLTSHPEISLRAVTVTPGTDEQVGLVRHVLRFCGMPFIPVGSCKPGYDKNCVSRFHYDWIGQFDSAAPDDEGHRIIAEAVRAYPDLTVLTGGPLKNFAGIEPDLPIARWVAQGGFAGDNVVPPEFRLPKFEGMVVCPTYNFNGAPHEALRMLASESIGQRLLISKNVCHGISYDAEFQARVHPFRNATPGLNLVYRGMEKYLEKRPGGKKFHDPLAACAAINPDIIEWREVEMVRRQGKWGSELRSGTNTWISIAADRNLFISEFVRN